MAWAINKIGAKETTFETWYWNLDTTLKGCRFQQSCPQSNDLKIERKIKNYIYFSSVQVLLIFL